MQFWIRRSALAALVVLSVSACAGESGGELSASPTTSTTTTSEAPTTSAAPAPNTGTGGVVEDTSTTLATTSPPPQVEGPVAPDFTFALADGSSFSLSGEQKPVYLVFWAEW